jgi:hypothetical protein
MSLSREKRRVVFEAHWMIPFAVQETEPVLDSYVFSFIQRIATVEREPMLPTKGEVVEIEFYVRMI